MWRSWTTRFCWGGSESRCPKRHDRGGMMKLLSKAVLAGCAFVLMLSSASARTFNIPGGSLEEALDAYTAQTGVDLVVSANQMKGVKSRGVKGNLPDEAALSQLLSGTGFVVRRNPGGAIGIARQNSADNEPFD